MENKEDKETNQKSSEVFEASWQKLKSRRKNVRKSI